MIVNRETGEILDIVVREEDRLMINPEAVDFIYKAEKQMKEIKKNYEEYKSALLQAMEEFGIDKIDTDNFTVNYVPAHMSNRVDSKKLQSEHPEIYDECSTASMVKPSVRVRLR